MKYLILLALLLTTACTNEIGLMPDNEPSKLIINALLSADGSQNRIYLHRSGWAEATELTDGIIHLYVNGEQVETITSRPTTESETGNVYYQANSHFKTGDKVRIEATAGNGAYYAEAETTVEEPIHIVRVDTAGIRIRNEWGNYSDVLRLQIELQVTGQQKERRYFRLQPVSTTITQVTNIETQKDSTIINWSYSFNGKTDVALTDGQPNSDTSDSGIEIFPPWMNYFGIFSDAFFKAGRYKMTVMINYPGSYIPGNYTVRSQASSVEVQLVSISAMEYHYLKALSLYSDANDTSPLENSIIIPSNVKNGIGFFAVENKASYTFGIKEE